MLNAKQIEALKKLAVAPALQNEMGAAAGITKFSDGTTFNGNLQNKLHSMGLVSVQATGRVNMRKVYGVLMPCKVCEWTITEAGKVAINA